MNVIIKKSLAKGEITAPPSKSYAHRLLICSFLANDNAVVENIQFSNDILETLNCLKGLGANFKINKSSVEFFKSDLTCNSALNFKESGSTLRFLIPISLALNEKVKLNVSTKLLERGISVYEELFKSKNIVFEKNQNEILINGKLSSGHYKLKGNISSQFISGLLFSLPLLENDSVIEIEKPFESKSYVDITLDTLKLFNIDIKLKEDNVFYIKGNQKYIARNTVVEGDYSNAAFFYALNYLGGDVKINGLNQNSKQGDKECVNIFNKIKNNDYPIDLSQNIDLAPIAFCLSACLNGGEFIGTTRLAIKESDRRVAIKTQLEKLGINVLIEGDSVKICKGNLKKTQSVLTSYNDHRIVMALSIVLTTIGGEIEDIESVNKSYLTFFEELSKLGVDIKYVSR